VRFVISRRPSVSLDAMTMGRHWWPDEYDRTSMHQPLYSRSSGFSILYRCPGCGQPRRHLYLRSLVVGRLVDYQGPLCQACAGLRWASQGRYIGVFHRAFRAGLGLQPSDQFPFPRHPRDPRAVSDPRLILDEFPDLVGDRPIGPARRFGHAGRPRTA
jgi:hypothetical protein